ncbi:maestro heat-like repeat-containing protein family member 1 [Amia ocellicauda]|uniref:maestro heat-like repeat-containing protein family member 1 n=1 Tax=Amia ocellicauda TaxID=2972642 RepID=UPI003464589F
MPTPDSSLPVCVPQPVRSVGVSTAEHREPEAAAIEPNKLAPWSVRVLIVSARNGHAVAARALVDLLSKNSLRDLEMDCSELIGSLLPLLGTEDRAKDGGLSVRSAAIQDLKLALSMGKVDTVAEQMKQDKAWALMGEPGQETEGISLLTRALMKFAAPILPSIVHRVWQSYGLLSAGQRVCAAAFFSTLLQNQRLMGRKLLASVIEMMLEVCEDHLEETRILAVQGLKAVPVSEIFKHAVVEMAELSGALCMPKVQGKPLILKSIICLRTVLQFCPDKLIPRLFPKAKEGLAHEDPEIREAYVLLLGTMLKTSSGKRGLRKQLHGSMACLLLQLLDPSPMVAQVCQQTLRKCVPAVESYAFSKAFENHFSEDTYVYTPLIRDATTALREKFPGMMSVYRDVALEFTKSPQPNQRASAAVFMGALLERIGVFSFCAASKLKKALSCLLSDPDRGVQISAEQSLAGFP